jgi:hypothetical protein
MCTIMQRAHVCMRRALRAVVPTDSGVELWDDPDLLPGKEPVGMLSGRFLCVPIRRSM